jgi:hypothetical protein
VEIDGFYSNGILRLAGYSSIADQPGGERDQLIALGENAAARVGDALKAKHPEVSTRVAMPHPDNV